jgi:hypothetical protein
VEVLGMTSALTRRSFIRYLAAGAAGTALTLPSPIDLFAAPQHTTAADIEVGQVTLDGLMLTYFSTPRANASTKFTIGKNFSSTFTLRLPQSPGIELTGIVPQAGAALPGNYRQHPSAAVKDAIILRSIFGRSAEIKSKQQPRASAIAAGKNTFSSAESSSPLQFYGLVAPKLQFSGGPNKMRFYFTDTSRQSFNLAGKVGPETAASMSGQYITNPSALVPPRFYWADVSAASGEVTFDLGLPSVLLSASPRMATATATAKITDQTGFRSHKLKQAFAPGNDIEITYYAAQEFASTNLMELEARPTGASISRVYIDKVFKTFAPAGVPK